MRVYKGRAETPWVIISQRIVIMLNLPNNIEGNERISRLVIGAILFIIALLGGGRVFMFLIGLILIVEGIIGWCGIPIIAEKLKLNDLFKKKEGP